MEEIDKEIAQCEAQIYEIYEIGLTLRDAWNLPHSESSRLLADGQRRTADLKARIRKLRAQRERIAAAAAGGR